MEETVIRAREPVATVSCKTEFWEGGWYTAHWLLPEARHEGIDCLLKSTRECFRNDGIFHYADVDYVSTYNFKTHHNIQLKLRLCIVYILIVYILYRDKFDFLKYSKPETTGREKTFNFDPEKIKYVKIY